LSGLKVHNYYSLYFFLDKLVQLSFCQHVVFRWSWYFNPANNRSHMFAIGYF